MLTVIGDLIADVIVLGAADLVRGTDNPAAITHTRGGSAANVAAAAAPHTRVRFIGRVGTDAEGQALVAELEAAGVEVRVQRGGRTGSIVILVDEAGERTMLTDRGAAAELDAIEPAWLDGTRWLHVPLYGFATAVSRAAVLKAVGPSPAFPVSLDLSSVSAMRELGVEGLRAVVDALSPAVVFANADEAELLDSFELDLPGELRLVVKRGGEPVILRARGVEDEVEVEQVDGVVDSTGAGDAFAAGFLAAALTGETPARCARAGAALARGALHRPGAL
ncbi:carbohydrate kinase family protein [Microbacterium sp. B2969]|uniref:Carbohydrate kinase family protein n=1 Tax=Microbacterium alkaliflavum TaxID=3248839 RepID=A0ABW7Q5X1_9MICO